MYPTPRIAPMFRSCQRGPPLQILVAKKKIWHRAWNSVWNGGWKTVKKCRWTILGHWTLSGLKHFRGHFGAFFKLFFSNFVLELKTYRRNFVLQRCHPKYQAFRNCYRNNSRTVLISPGPSKQKISVKCFWVRESQNVNYRGGWKPVEKSAGKLCWRNLLRTLQANLLNFARPK